MQNAVPDGRLQLRSVEAPQGELLPAVETALQPPVRSDADAAAVPTEVVAHRGDQPHGAFGAGKPVSSGHPLPLTGIDIAFTLRDDRVEIQAAVTCTGVTGVEMESLTAVSAAALTIYDMCKAVQKDMRITNIRLLEKSGGKSGYIAEE